MTIKEIKKKPRQYGGELIKIYPFLSIFIYDLRRKTTNNYPTKQKLATDHLVS